MAKEKKVRAEKYEPKVAINGSFMDVIKISLMKPKSKTATKAKKSK